jgi:cytochrome P450
MSLLKFLQHSYSGAKHPIDFFKKLKKKNVDPFLIYVSPRKTVLISGKETAVRDFFTIKSINVRKLDFSEPLELLLGENSFLTSIGKSHLKIKRAFFSTFHARDKLEKHDKVISLRVKKHLNDITINSVVNINDMAQKLTLNIIADIIFGADDEDGVTQLVPYAQKLINSYTPLVMFFPWLRLPFLPHWQRFKMARERYDNFFLNKIQKRIDSDSVHGEDLLSSSVTIAENFDLDLSIDLVSSYLRTFLIAGHDPTYHSLIWVIYHVFSSEKVKKKLRNELQGISVDSDLENLPYLNAVCNEALRLHPPVPFAARTADKPFTFCGKEIQAGETVGIATSLLHHDPEYWNNPGVFDPDRFLNLETINVNYFFPFGGGVKKCLGATMAMYIMRRVLAILVTQYELTILNKKIPSTKTYGLVVGATETVKARFAHHSPRKAEKI